MLTERSDWAYTSLAVFLSTINSDFPVNISLKQMPRLVQRRIFRPIKYPPEIHCISNSSINITNQIICQTKKLC